MASIRETTRSRQMPSCSGQFLGRALLLQGRRRRYLTMEVDAAGFVNEDGFSPPIERQYKIEQLESMTG